MDTIISHDINNLVPLPAIQEHNWPSTVEQVPISEVLDTDYQLSQADSPGIYDTEIAEQESNPQM